MSLHEYFPHFKDPTRCVFTVKYFLKYVLEGSKAAVDIPREKRDTAPPAILLYLHTASQSVVYLPDRAETLGNARVLSVTREQNCENNILLPPSSSPPGYKSLPAPASYPDICEGDAREMIITITALCSVFVSWSPSQQKNRTTISDSGSRINWVYHFIN